MQPLLHWKSIKNYIFCMSVDLSNQQAMAMHHILICSLYGSTIFFNIISYTAQFLKKKY